jgi:chlorophyll synthase
MLGGQLPDARILLVAGLYSIGAHGIMTLNDFKSIDGDRQLGLQSLPVQLGAGRAARLACWVMALPQVCVVVLLWHWQSPIAMLIVGGALLLQLYFMQRLLSEPRRFAPWYNATGVSLYVSGMMATAVALRFLHQG